MFHYNKSFFYELIEYVVNKSFMGEEKKTYTGILCLLLSVKENKITHFKNNVFNNMFINETDKYNCLKIFSKAQYYYNNLKKLAKQIKFNKMTINNNFDLSLYPIHDTKHILKFMLIENSVKYEFKLGDLICIINNSLLDKIEHFYSDPKPIRNPYTNIEFSKHNLYNIYFAIKNSTFIMPVLFHLFLLSDFDIITFNNNNESILRDMLIKKYINTCSERVLIKEMRKMFNDGKIIGRTNKNNIESIHEEISNNQLIQIFKPFVELYLYALFTLNFNKKLNTKHMLYKKLTGFFIENPKFGRKYICTKKNKNKELFVFTAITRFNEKYNLIVKNNFNSINIDNIHIPGRFEWGASNTNRHRVVPPVRLLPNTFQSLDISSSVVDLTNDHDIVAEFTINDDDDDVSNEDSVSDNDEDEDGIGRGGIHNNDHNNDHDNDDAHDDNDDDNDDNDDDNGDNNDNNDDNNDNNDDNDDDNGDNNDDNGDNNDDNGDNNVDNSDNNVDNGLVDNGLIDNDYNITDDEDTDFSIEAVPFILSSLDYFL